jgi:hypothetical protein
MNCKICTDMKFIGRCAHKLESPVDNELSKVAKFLKDFNDQTNFSNRQKVKLELGELYYNPMSGLCVITRLFEADESKRGYHGCEIGRYERLRIRSRSFTLYDDKDPKFRLASDKDIIEYLVDELNQFNLGKSSNGDSCILSITEDGIYISGDEFVSLNKEQVRRLKEWLSREVD